MRFLLLLTLIFVFACQPTTQKNETPQAVKNIILLIGDGMGISQVTAGLYANSNKLNLEKFKYIGFHKNYSYDNLITDSAAGATAFSIGKKSYNGAIGVDHDTVPHPTILEMAEEKGYASGLIATSTITHATPAAFISHQASRRMYEEIANDFLNTDIDYFVGGGLDHFTKRKDNRNLVDSLVAKGYLVSDSTQIAFDEFQADLEKNFGYFTAMGSPVKYSEGRKYLESATKKGIEFLSDRAEQGFFLMVEASQIDWAGHDNDQENIIQEMLEFDRVIDLAYQFAKEDGNTLVIVTADHETGGMSITKDSKMDSLVCTFASGSHTADLIPVFAFGPGADEFAGIYENTAIFDKMKQAFGW